MLDIKTDLGKLNISKSVVARIVSEAVNTLEGDVYLTNHKGKVLKLVNSTGFIDNSPAMEVTVNGSGEIEIKFYLLLKFGTSITAVTNRIFDIIESEMIAMTDIKPSQMTIVITGVYNGDIKKTAKREVEVKRP